MPDSTFSEALAAHRKLMSYFGSAVTNEDYQRGAMLEALHYLELNEPKRAHEVLTQVLKNFGHAGPLAESIMNAANWIDLNQTDQATEELRKLLTKESK